MIMIILGVSGETAFSQCMEQQKLTAAEAEFSDYFGFSVAIDGNTAVVGAPGNSGGVVSLGSAYVFTRTEGTWTEEAKLTASDGASGDSFGDAVAIDGDTIVVGAGNEDGNDPGSDTGSAYVFVRSGGVWTEQAKLHASDADFDDGFGQTSLDIDGDTIVVGSWTNSAPWLGTGAAYVFVRTGGIWTEQAKLVASDADFGDFFGYSVAVNSETIVVGAAENDDAGSLSGAVYVFVRSGSVWTEQAKLNASDAAQGDKFGYSVAVDGDTAFVAAPYDDDGGSNSGSVYIFMRNGAVWTEQAKLNASDAEPGDRFGHSIALNSDAAIVGAPTCTDPFFCEPASAYVFARTGGVWSEQSKVTASDAEAADGLGYSVGIDGATAVAGTHREGVFTSDAAYVFYCGPTGPEPIPAASAWGLGAMTLLMITVGTLVLRTTRATQPFHVKQSVREGAFQRGAGG